MGEIYNAYKVEKINDYLFIDTYKSNNIKFGVNDMTVNDSEMEKRKESCFAAIYVPWTMGDKRGRPSTTK